MNYRSQLLSFFLAAFLLLQLNGKCEDVPKPDSVNAPYGQYERNIYDFWKAKSDKPTPLVIYIHGGGFNQGSKEKVSASMVTGLLKEGISVIAINYRLTPDAVFPQHYQDCARAIQFARFHAKELNIDPNRVAATGSSAGACASLWLGFHDDLADPKSNDPVLRMSTKLSSVAMFSGQSTLDPDTIRAWVGELALKHSMFNGKFLGLKPNELGSVRAKELYVAASPVTYLTKNAPPVFAYYSNPRTAPTVMNEAIHHYNFGLHLKEKMDALGVECVLLDKESGISSNKSCIEFFMKHFQMKTKK